MVGGLINHLWQSTLFGLAAASLTIVFRNNRAGIRFWLWLTASFKFLLPFSPLMSLGRSATWRSVTGSLTTGSTWNRILAPNPAPLSILLPLPICYQSC